MMNKAIASHRRLRVLGADAVLALLLLLLALAGVSRAALTRSYTGTSLGPGGVASGSFNEVSSIAVNKSHDVYVLDKVGEEGRVYKFDAAGAPVNFSSTGTNEIKEIAVTPYGGGETEIAVDNSSGPAAGDIYVASLRHVWIYSESGEKLGVLERETGELHGVSVGPTGEVYVSYAVNGSFRIVRLAPTANPVTWADESGSMAGSSLGGEQTIATDPAGDVYVNVYGGIRKYDALQFGSLTAEGELVDPQDPESYGYMLTVAVDQADGHVFGDQQTFKRAYVREYDGSTTPPAALARFGEEEPGALNNHSYGVAIDEASEKLYVGDGSTVEIFGLIYHIPSVQTEAATNISTSEATLHGTVEPAGQEVTSCEFEYRPTSTTAAKDAPCEPSPPITGGATATVPVTAHVSGLNAGVSYRVRLLGATSGGPLSGESLSFVTVAVPNPLVLPDGRGYERVSLPENGEVDTIQDVPINMAPTEAGHTEQPFLVAPSGEAVAYMGYPGETGGIGKEGANFGNQYIARRLPSEGWRATDVSPPSIRVGDTPVFQGFTPDLSGGFVTAESPFEGAPGEGFHDLYYTTFGTGKYTPENTVAPPHRTKEEFGSYYVPTINGKAPSYEGSTPDRSHVLFAANDALTVNAPVRGAGQDNLYDSSEGKLTLVNVKPNGTPEAGATVGGTELEEIEQNGPMLDHAVSEDGKRIFWTSVNSLDLYVRENDTAPEENCTVPTDACTKLIGEEAQFWDATPNGSKVLYTQEGGLYIRDLETNETEELAGGGVKGVVADTENLEYVYFVAGAALAPGAEAVNCQLYQLSTREHCNLYALRVGEAPKYVGQLTGHDNDNNPESFYTHAGDWTGSLGWREAQATPDGKHLLFESNSHLTGYESKEASEVFMYDFTSSAITCLSCKASGEELKFQGAEGYVGSFLPVSHVSTALPHWMSDDGDRAFFDSVSALVPQDTNQTTDVYEWEREGAGRCNLNPGCIYLISSGSAREGSWLIGASASGNDVFFTTRSKMVPKDENEYVDVYDARVGAKAPATPPECTGTGCQGVPSAPPVFATPPSQTYNGVGNLEPTTASPISSKQKPLTLAQKLKRTLKACGKERRKKRAVCERHARRRYGKAKGSSSSKRQINRKLTSGRGR